MLEPDRPRAERRLDPPGLTIERCGPAEIVVHELDGAVVPVGFSDRHSSICSSVIDAGACSTTLLSRGPPGTSLPPEDGSKISSSMPTHPGASPSFGQGGPDAVGASARGGRR